MLTKLPYGISNGKLVSIDEVDKGLSCGCTCPGCGALLIARKGEVKAHHFAHYNAEECVGAIETALHLAAKEILKNSNELLLPSLERDFYELFSDEQIDVDYQSIYEHPELTPLIEESVVIIPEQIINYERVDLEVSFNEIRPDAVLYSRDKPLLVEIAVTHFVDFEKQEKITKLGLSAIEIDLSYLSDGFTDDELKDEVLKGTFNRQWLYNAREDNLKNKFLLDRKKKVAELRLRDEEMLMKSKRDLQLRKNEKRDYNLKGFRIIEFDYQIFGIMCPKAIRSSSNNYKRNEIIDKLRLGASWNGKIYGNPRTGFSIYLSGEKIIVMESREILEDLPAYVVQDMQHLLGQLRSIIHTSKRQTEDCQNCQFFEKYLDDKFMEVVCKFKV